MFWNIRDVRYIRVKNLCTFGREEWYSCSCI